MFGKSGIASLLKQAQQMQTNLQQAQAELPLIEVEGHSGDGMVKVVMSCAHDVKRVTLDSQLLKGLEENKEILEDLIAAAFNDASRKADAATQEKMADVSGGLNLPVDIKLPFPSC